MMMLMMMVTMIRDTYRLQAVDRQLGHLEAVDVSYRSYSRTGGSYCETLDDLLVSGAGREGER